MSRAALAVVDAARLAGKRSTLAAMDEIIGLERARRVIAARQDVNAFAEYVFEDTRTRRPLVQAEVHRDLQAAIDAHAFTFAELPRFHGKTEQVVVIRVLFWLGKNPDELIKIATETDRQARARIKQIAAHILYNPRLREVFPHLVPNSKRAGWTQHSLTVARTVMAKDGSIEAYGVASGVIGGRATKLVFDDVTKPRAVRSEADRESTKDAVYGVWLPMVEEEEEIPDEPPEVLQGDEGAAPGPSEVDGEGGGGGKGEPENLDALFGALPAGERNVRKRERVGADLAGYVGPEGGIRFEEDTAGVRVVWIGTPWHAADAHCELRDNAEKLGWFLYSRAVAGDWAREKARERGEPDDDFAPVWPEKWSRGKLKARHRRTPSTHFARAFYLLPMSTEDRVWDPADFVPASWAEFDELEADGRVVGAVGAWDFAFGKKTRNDWTATVSLAVDDRDHVWVIRAVHFRAGLLKTGRRIVSWSRSDRLDHVGFEATQAQVWAGEYAEHLAALPLRKIRPTTDKYSRAVLTQPYVEQGRVHFLPGTEDLQAELGQFPLGRHDDLADAFVYALLLVIEFIYQGDPDAWDEEGEDEDGVYEDDHVRIAAAGGRSGDEPDAPTGPGILERVFGPSED